MISISKIHLAGVNHGTLLSDDGTLVVDGLRHFVLKTEPCGRTRVLTVDFTAASLHVCSNATPALHNGDECPDEECEELVALERGFGQILDGGLLVPVHQPGW